MTIQLSHEQLLASVKYCPDTGVFTRKNKVLGTNNGAGYSKFSVEGKLYFAHRLAWFYVYGEWPDGLIDHINRNKSDNRIENLRVVGHSKNGHNANLSKRNKTGYSGVTQIQSGKYRACFVKDRKRIHIGYYDTPEQAHCAYLEVKRKVSPL